jgi:DNA polymerase III subunit gamma/tau
MSEPRKSAVSGSAPAEAPADGYRVLARKYRPASFEDLIGQDAMVRTVSNAFESGRIPQAWILTGVRGVGKTTTARILARALNYELPDGSVKEPTIRMPVMGVHCQAIIESRHPDVLEMDAASHNSVEDVRQINDAIRYAPMSARYKVYILDEVHMLSGAAFNALLKTLEEPPPHAKFIFATTEIRKVPVTVLSRCQRFDLRRVDAALLVDHLQGIAAKEKAEIEPAALALIARAAEGSVRDSLSLLDQAMAHAAGPVRAEYVRQMLGLADRVRVVDLFEALMKGDAAGRLKSCVSNMRSVQILPSSLPISLSSPTLSHASKSFRRSPTTCRCRRPNARAGALLRRNCRCACCRVPGRCFSRVSPRCRHPGVRSPPPRWCWYALPMQPICRRPMKSFARSAKTALHRPVRRGTAGAFRPRPKATRRATRRRVVRRDLLRRCRRGRRRIPCRAGTTRSPHPLCPSIRLRI